VLEGWFLLSAHARGGRLMIFGERTSTAVLGRRWPGPGGVRSESQTPRARVAARSVGHLRRLPRAAGFAAEHPLLCVALAGPLTVGCAG